jgi:hypothetical protein
MMNYNFLFGNIDSKGKLENKEYGNDFNSEGLSKLMGFGLESIGEFAESKNEDIDNFEDDENEEEDLMEEIEENEIKDNNELEEDLIPKSCYLTKEARNGEDGPILRFTELFGSIKNKSYKQIDPILMKKRRKKGTLLNKK